MSKATFFKFKVKHYVERLLDYKLFDLIASSIVILLIILHLFLYSTQKEDNYQKSDEYKNIEVSLSEDFNFFLNTNHLINYKIKKKDTIIKILSDIGISDNEIFDILKVMREKINPKSIVVGQNLILKYHVKKSYKDIINENKEAEESSILNELIIKVDSETQIAIIRQSDDSYLSFKVEKELNKKIVKYDFIINNSLFFDGQKFGVPTNTMINIINLYSFDVDFQRDIRAGDRVEILLENFYQIF